MKITITNWSEKFENSDTRKRQRLGWFLAPSGCDSKGYRQLMRKGRDGIISLGVFQALCQLMATLSKDARKSGILSNSDGSGMEVADLWEITRMEVADLEMALDLLEKVKWLSIDNQFITVESATHLPPICHPSASSVPENSGFVKGEGEGEGEGEVSATPLVETPAIAWSSTDGWSGISQKDQEEWYEAYPTCAIPRQLAAMNQWLLSNPSKAKKKLWRKFITNWLGREQEKGGDMRGKPESSLTEKPSGTREMQFGGRTGHVTKL